VPKPSVATGKKLLRDLTRYAQAVQKVKGIGFFEAVRFMRDHAEEAAREIGVSSAFVTLWAETELRQAGR